MLRNTANTERGFTLIELLIAMALSLVVLTSLSSAFISQRKTYDAQEQVSDMIQATRGAMEIITREIKLAGFDPTGQVFDDDTCTSGCTWAIPHSTTQLEIRADLNGDGETDGTASNNDTNEEIIYSYDATYSELERDAGQAWSYAKVLAENIQSFSFDYLDADGVATTNPALIRMIEVTIVARTEDPDPDYSQNNGYRTYTLTSTVVPPNLAIN